MIATVILLTVLATAVISGVLGMAGGLALMAVLTSLLPVSGAMILHGAVQAASNGARFVFLRERMMWGVPALLDAFYLETDVDRRTIVATKAFTQTVGHLLKIGYYVWVSRTVLTELPGSVLTPWLIAGGMALAVVGARIGTLLLGRLDDRQFLRVTGPVILALGALCVAKGARELLLAG